MPNAIKTSNNSRYRGEKGVAHPNGKHGVFLSERLPGCYLVVVNNSYFATQIKLKRAANKRYYNEPQLRG